MKRGKLVMILLGAVLALAAGAYLLAPNSMQRALPSPRSIAPPTADLYLEASSWEALDRFETEWVAGRPGLDAYKGIGGQLKNLFAPHPAFESWADDSVRFGLDTKRPLGAVIRLSEDGHSPPTTVHFIPLADADAFARNLRVNSRNWSKNSVECEGVHLGFRGGYLIASLSKIHVDGLLELRGEGIGFAQKLDHPLLAVYVTPRLIETIAKELTKNEYGGEFGHAAEFGREIVRSAATATSALLLELDWKEDVLVSLTVSTAAENSFAEIFVPAESHGDLKNRLIPGAFTGTISLDPNAARNYSEALLSRYRAAQGDSTPGPLDAAIDDLPAPLSRWAGFSAVAGAGRMVLEFNSDAETIEFEKRESRARERARLEWQRFMRSSGFKRALMTEKVLPSFTYRGITLMKSEVSSVLDPENRDNPALSRPQIETVWRGQIPSSTPLPSGRLLLTYTGDSPAVARAQIDRIIADSVPILGEAAAPIGGEKNFAKLSFDPSAWMGERPPLIASPINLAAHRSKAGEIMIEGRLAREGVLDLMRMITLSNARQRME